MDRVLYLCDRRACQICNKDICSYTSDIRHAVNFEKFADGDYREKERTSLDDIMASYYCDVIMATNNTDILIEKEEPHDDN